MTCDGKVYKRWGPQGCARREMIDRQRELYRQAEPVIVEGKELKVRRSEHGVMVSPPQPPVRKRGNSK